MEIYKYSIWWRYSSENFEDGIVRANSVEEAKEKVKKQYEGSNCIGFYVSELEWENDTCVIYSK